MLKSKPFVLVRPLCLEIIVRIASRWLVRNAQLKMKINRNRERGAPNDPLRPLFDFRRRRQMVYAHRCRSLRVQYPILYFNGPSGSVFIFIISTFITRTTH